MMATRALVAVACALALTGCMVGPDYVRPQASAPAAYKELPPNKPAQPADTAPRGQWWKVYGDPELDTLQDEVIAANQTLRVAEANYRQARAAVRASRAELFPGVGASLGGTRARAANSRGGGTASVFTASADVTWEVDLWGGIRRAVEASESSAQASAAELANTQLSLQSELAQNYLQLRVADATRRVLQDTVEAYERSMTLTQNRYNAGVAARADVVQAETQLLSAKVNLIDIENTRAQFEHAIAALVGKAPADLSIAPRITVPNVPAVPAGVPSELLERRPDVAAAERRVAAANAQIGVATAAIYPALTLSASGGFIGSSVGNWISLPNRFWSLGASLAGTIFDGGLLVAQRDEAVAAYDATTAQYRQAVLDAFRDVEDQLAAIRILEEEARVQAERNNVELAGRRFSATIALIKALGGGWQASDLPVAAATAEAGTPAR
ncbi:MAG TPA: efflux transporter outer membrane subunit [Casimicrobiaceae bacterium]|nr:efflux transporter outer membrane subunit [Casimicrobiaceae bacterium]